MTQELPGTAWIPRSLLEQYPGNLRADRFTMITRLALLAARVGAIICFVLAVLWFVNTFVAPFKVFVDIFSTKQAQTREFTINYAKLNYHGGRRSLYASSTSGFAADSKNADFVISGVLHGFLESTNGRIIEQKAIETDGALGREVLIQIENNPLRMIGRVYFTGPNVLQFLAVGENGSEKSAEVDKFFNSVHVSAGHNLSYP